MHKYNSNHVTSLGGLIKVSGKIIHCLACLIYLLYPSTSWSVKNKGHHHKMFFPFLFLPFLSTTICPLSQPPSSFFLYSCCHCLFLLSLFPSFHLPALASYNLYILFGVTGRESPSLTFLSRVTAREVCEPHVHPERA